MKECTSNSPVNVTLSVVGGKWKAVILWYLSQEKLRFNELTRRVSGITQKMLTQQLREMEDDGLIQRKIYPEVPPRVEYSITAYGQTLQPVLHAMAQWGEKHAERLKLSETGAGVVHDAEKIETSV
jgi:DNA-binding HxlR family transcriptional regulator